MTIDTVCLGHSSHGSERPSCQTEEQASVSVEKSVYWRCQIPGHMPGGAEGWCQLGTRGKLCVLKVALLEWWST